MSRGGGGGRGGGGRGNGAFGGDGLNAVLDALDTQMLLNYRAFRDAILTTWETFSGNDGQMTIVQNHILPMSRDYVQQAKEEWPWSGDADEYLENLMSCYDSDVMERAFSGTIYDLYDTIYGYWVESDELQQTHDDILGDSRVHSTNPPWT